MIALCESGFDGEVLILAGNQIGNDGLIAFTKNVSNFGNLRTLDLRDNDLEEKEDLVEALKTLAGKKVSLLVNENLNINEGLLAKLNGEGVWIAEGASLD